VLLSTRTGEDAGEGIVAFVTGKFIDLVIGGEKSGYTMPGLGIIFRIFDRKLIVNLLIGDAGKALLYTGVGGQANARLFLARG